MSSHKNWNIMRSRLFAKNEGQDVFISYGSETRSIVPVVEKELRSLGFTTFWDKELRDDWHKELGDMIEKSKAVIVLALPRILDKKRQGKENIWAKELQLAHTCGNLILTRISEEKIDFPGFLSMTQVHDLSILTRRELGDLQTSNWVSEPAWGRVIDNIAARCDRPPLSTYMEVRQKDINTRAEWLTEAKNRNALNDPLAQIIQTDFETYHLKLLDDAYNTAEREAKVICTKRLDYLMNIIQEQRTTYNEWILKKLVGEHSTSVSLPRAMDEHEELQKKKEDIEKKSGELQTRIDLKNIEYERLSGEFEKQKEIEDELNKQLDDEARQRAETEVAHRRALNEAQEKSRHSEEALAVLKGDYEIMNEALQSKINQLNLKLQDLEDRMLNLKRDKQKRELKIADLSAQLEVYETAIRKPLDIHSPVVRIAVNKARDAEVSALRSQVLAYNREKNIQTGIERRDHFQNRQDGGIVIPIEHKGIETLARIEWSSNSSSQSCIYLGEVDGLVPHGFGVLRFTSGIEYAGEWKDGKKHGTGIYLEPIKNFTAFWRGQWAYGNAKGYGISHKAPGDFYEGEIITLGGNIIRHGYGAQVKYDGNIIEALWANNTQKLLEETSSII